MTPPSGRIVTKIIFPVADLDAAVAFYERLGFDVERFDAGYAWVRHAGEEVLHLRLVADLDPASNRASGYFHVADADAWHEAWRDAGADPEPVADQPWGMREFRLVDPSGNLVRVGHST